MAGQQGMGAGGASVGGAQPGRPPQLATSQQLGQLLDPPQQQQGLQPGAVGGEQDKTFTRLLAAADALSGGGGSQQAAFSTGNPFIDSQHGGTSQNRSVIGSLLSLFGAGGAAV